MLKVMHYKVKMRTINSKEDTSLTQSLNVVKIKVGVLSRIEGV